MTFCCSFLYEHFNKYLLLKSDKFFKLEKYANDVWLFIFQWIIKCIFRIRTCKCTMNINLAEIEQDLHTEVVHRRTFHSTQTHYFDSEPTSLYSYFLKLYAYQISRKYLYYFKVFCLTKAGFKLMTLSTSGKFFHSYLGV